MFKKICSSVCLIFIILSQLQVLQVYAQGQAELNAEKEKGEQTLDAVESVIDTAVEKIDTKLGNNTKKKNQLEEKHEEIEAYLDEVQADIASENNSEDIKERVEEAKKVVVLKVVSGITEYEDVEDAIDSEVANTPAEVETALETIQDSLETESGDYSIIVRSSKNIGEVQDLFATFDPEIKIEEMYETDGKNYFEVFLAEDSIFREEMLEDIESGILPERFLGVDIVLPEVFGINNSFLNPYSLQEQGAALISSVALLSSEGEEIQRGGLEGENISQTWGIEKYKSYNYIDSHKENSQKIRVGVVDTGIDYNHPDLKNNVNQRLGKDFVNDDDDAWDDQGHGTHVAGTIAANINGEGIMGVNPYVELVPLKICTNRGFCPSYAVLRALEYAKTEQIDILNMSLGGRGNPSGHAICAGISSVVASGGIVVAASGNSNIDTSRFVPGGCSDAITVAAVDDEGNRARFSNYGDKVDVAAPGVQVYSSYPMNKGTYKKLSGTSMATPHVVGIISLMQSRDPGMTASEAKIALKKYTSPVSTDRTYKTIANGVDLEKLMQSYETLPEKSEEIVETTETLQEEVVVTDSDEIVQETSSDEAVSEGEGEGREESILLKSSEADNSITQAEVEATKVNVLDGDSDTNNEADDEDGITLKPSSIPLDLGEAGVEINASSEYTYQSDEDSLDLEIIDMSEAINIADSQVFDTNGEIITDTVEINNADEVTTNGTSVGEDFDYENLDTQEKEEMQEIIIDENSLEYVPDEEEQVEQLLIDGAKAGVEINNTEEAVEFEFEEGEFNPEDIDFGNENLGSGELVETVEIIENIDIKHTDSINIDGAEAGVKINSLDEESGELLELSEFDQDTAIFDIIEGEEITGYSDDNNERVEINSFGDEEGDVEEILYPEIEEIEAFDYSDLDEIFVDGAEAGVEINSIDIPEVPETRFDEFSIEDVVIEDIQGEDITGYDPEEDSGVEINSLDGEDKDIGEITIISEDDMIIEEIEEVEYSDEEIFIDGAEAGVEINSLDGEEEYEEIEIPEYGSNTFDFEKNIGEAIEGYDLEEESGIEINSSENDIDDFGDLTEISEDDMVIEEIEEIEYSNDELVFPDEGGIEINSFSDDVGGYQDEIPEFDEDEVFFSEDEIIELEIPQEILDDLGGDSSDTQIEFTQDMLEEFSEVDIEEFNEDEEGENIGIQNAYSHYVTLYPGSKGIVRVWGSPYYDFKTSDSSIASFEKSLTHISFTGLKPGETVFKTYYKGHHYHTIYVTVKKPVGTQHIYKTYPLRETYRINMPELIGLRLSSKSYNGGSVGMRDYRNTKGYVDITGYKAGNKDYYFRDSGGAILYVLHVKINPRAAKQIDINVIKGDTSWNFLNRASEYSMSFSKTGYAKISRTFSYIKTTGLKAGSFQIYLKQNGVHKYTLNITVKDSPKNISKIITTEGKTNKVYVPIKGRYYIETKRFDTTAQSRIYSNGSTREIRSYKPGYIEYYFKNQYGRIVHQINLTIKPKPPVVKTFSVFEGQRINNYLYLANTYDLSFSRSGYASISRNGRYIYTTGKKAGTFEMYLKKDGIHRYTFKVTVKEVPKPKHYYGFVIEGEQTRINLPKGETLRTSVKFSNGGSAGFRDYRQYSGYIYANGYKPGMAQLFFKNSLGHVQYIVNLTILPKPPQVIPIETFVGQQARNYLYAANNYDISYSKSGYAKLYRSSRYIYTTGTKAGDFKVYLKQNGVHRYTLNIKIKALPKPKEYTVNVHEGKETRVYLPLKFSYRFYRNGTNTGKAEFHNYGYYGFVKIIGRAKGRVSYQIRDSKGIHRYTVTANIIATPPPIEEVKVTESRYLTLHGNFNLKPSTSKSGYIQVYTYRGRDYINVRGLKPGTVYISLKDSYGAHKKTYKVTVEAKPKPIVYNKTVYSGSSIHMTLPEDISNFWIYGNGDNIFDYINRNGKNLYFSTKTVGKYTMRMYDRKTGFEKYQINITAKAEESHYTLNYTDFIEVWGHPSYRDYSQNSSIASHTYAGKKSYLRGRKVGSTTIKFYKNGGLRKIWHVTVNPIPDPKKIFCTTTVGKDCDFRIPNDGYYDKESRSGVADIESTSNKIEVTGKKSGTLSVYVRSEHGNYITHILNVTVKAKPAKQITCSVPLGLSCTGIWHGDRNYEYKVSAKSIVETRNSHEMKRVSGRWQKTGREGLEIIGKKIGKVSVYVYVDGDHYATITTNVLPAVPQITHNGGNIKVYEGNTHKFQITSGGGDYQVVESDSGIHSFIINNQNGRKADVSIDGKKVGKNNVLIRDKYHQYKSLTVRVEETRLVLSNNYNTYLSTGRSEYVDVLSRYKGISSLTPSNDTIRAELVRDLNGNEQIKIIPLKAGSAYLRVQDQKGSVQYLSFRVNGKDVEEEKKNTDESSGKANFKEIHYSEKSNNEGLDTLGFKLEGTFDEVGIFYLENGEVYKQVLNKVKGNLYILSCADTCPEKSLPYIISNNTYKKASVNYITFGEENYSVANIETSGVEINTIVKKGDVFHQSGDPDFGTKNSIGFHYLNGMEIAVIDFLNNDTNNYTWDGITATKIVNLASGKRTLQSSIDAIPDIKDLWDEVNRDIRNGTHSYSDETRKYLKGYLGISAVIEEDNWRELDQKRVKEYINGFHAERKLISKTIWDAFYDNQHYRTKHEKFYSEAQTIITRVRARFIKNPSFSDSFSGVTKITYSKQNVEILKSIGAITQEEYNVLIKIEDEYKKVYKEGLKELAFTDKREGAVDGSDQALEDYIVSSMELFNPTEFLEVLYALKDVDLESLTEDFEELAAIYKNREEIFAGLSEYDKAYYTGYIKTTLAMVIVPVKLDKANKLKKNKTVSNPCPLPTSVKNGIGTQSNCKRDVVSELKEVKKIQTVNVITKSLVGKYGNYKCEPFADEFRKKLDKEGIKYTEVEVYDLYGRGLSSLDAEEIFGTQNISLNGSHYATRIGDKIYDNVHPEGISVEYFKYDIGIKEFPDGFRNLKGLD